MVIIRQAQIEELNRPRRARFEERAGAVLARHFPQRAAAHSPETWNALVHEALELGLRMGLTIDEDVLEFAVYAFSSSENPVTIALPAWFWQIADDLTIGPQVRLAALSIACRPYESGHGEAL
jgi:hypothetical protein